MCSEVQSCYVISQQNQGPRCCTYTKVHFLIWIAFKLDDTEAALWEGREGQYKQTDCRRWLLNSVVVTWFCNFSLLYKNFILNYSSVTGRSDFKGFFISQHSCHCSPSPFQNYYNLSYANSAAACSHTLKEMVCGVSYSLSLVSYLATEAKPVKHHFEFYLAGW